MSLCARAILAFFWLAAIVLLLAGIFFGGK